MYDLNVLLFGVVLVAGLAMGYMWFVTLMSIGYAIYTGAAYLHGRVPGE